MFEKNPAMRRIALQEATRDVTGLRKIDESRPFALVQTAAGISGFEQDGITFAMDGYEKKKA